MYKRVLYKVSGEALMGDLTHGHDPKMLSKVVGEIKTLHETGVQFALVVGGGNIFRGLSGAAANSDRVLADQMGMLATVMNGLALLNAFKEQGVKARLFSNTFIPQVCEPFKALDARQAMDDGEIVICTAGLGNPYFTTDTASALKALELNCEALLKGTQVDGVYNKDPNRFDDAKRYDKVTYDEVIAKNLKVMDMAAFALAKDGNLPILVFNIDQDDALKNAVLQKGHFTLVH